MTLVDSIFRPDEAAMIKTISLHNLTREDKLVWLGTPSGWFTARSAYLMQVEAKQMGLGQSSDQRSIHKF